MKQKKAYEETFMTVNKFNGSQFWLIFWILMFWPIAIAYYLTKKTPTIVKVQPPK